MVHARFSKGPLLVLLALAVLGHAGGAGAAPRYIGDELTLQFLNLGRAEATHSAFHMAEIFGVPPSPPESHLSSLALPPIAIQQAIPVTDPNAAPITSAVVDFGYGSGTLGNLSAAQNGTQFLSPSRLPATGGVTMCLFAMLVACPAQLNLPLGGTSMGTPVGLGAGGLLTVGGTGTIRISVLGAGFTVNTVSAFNRTANGEFDIVTARGWAHGPGSLTSSTTLTSGVLQLVSATRTTAVGPGDGDISGVIARRLIHISIPEPGLAAMLLSGSLGLALLGRSRWKNSGSP